MEVTEEEYEKCVSTRPLFFSNNGNTVFKVDRPGLFFFISGVRGHCERGQKMIIKVLDIEATPSPQYENGTAPKPHSKSGVAELTPMRIMTASTVFVMATFFLQLYVWFLCVITVLGLFVAVSLFILVMC